MSTFRGLGNIEQIRLVGVVEQGGCGELRIRAGVKREVVYEHAVLSDGVEAV